jgi:hypothetical protein
MFSRRCPMKIPPSFLRRQWAPFVAPTARPNRRAQRKAEQQRTNERTTKSDVDAGSRMNRSADVPGMSAAPFLRAWRAVHDVQGTVRGRKDGRQGTGTDWERARVQSVEPPPLQLIRASGRRTLSSLPPLPACCFARTGPHALVRLPRLLRAISLKKSRLWGSRQAVPFGFCFFGQNASIKQIIQKDACRLYYQLC